MVPNFGLVVVTIVYKQSRFASDLSTAIRLHSLVVQTNGILITVNSLLPLQLKIIQAEFGWKIFGNFAEKINFPMNIGHCPDGFRINLLFIWK